MTYNDPNEAELREKSANGPPASPYATQTDFYKGAQEAKGSTEAMILHEARCTASPPARELPRT